MANAINSRSWLLIANGAPLSSDYLNKLARNKQVMVLDGAYEYAKQVELSIDVLLGDFDSINPDILAAIRKSSDPIKIIDAPDQNKTDLEKGLDYIDKQNPEIIYICAATGLRLQHTLYNLRILKKYHRADRPLILLSETELIRYYENTEINIAGQINECIALLGFPHASISTSGLKYDVTDYFMEFEKRNSICNALAQSQANIKIHGEALVIREIANQDK